LEGGLVGFARFILKTYGSTETSEFEREKEKARSDARVLIDQATNARDAAVSRVYRLEEDIASIRTELRNKTAALQESDGRASGLRDRISVLEKQAAQLENELSSARASVARGAALLEPSRLAGVYVGGLAVQHRGSSIIHRRDVRVLLNGDLSAGQLWSCHLDGSLIANVGIEALKGNENGRTFSATTKGVANYPPDDISLSFLPESRMISWHSKDTNGTEMFGLMFSERAENRPNMPFKCPTSTFGAMAISMHGDYVGLTYGQTSAAEAERKAKDDCGVFCKEITLVQEACAAWYVGLSPNGLSVKGLSQQKRTLREAEVDAKAKCQQGQSIECHLRSWVCNQSNGISDGGHNVQTEPGKFQEYRVDQDGETCLRARTDRALPCSIPKFVGR
jgi:hypothetical protein